MGARWGLRMRLSSVGCTCAHRCMHTWSAACMCGSAARPAVDAWAGSRTAQLPRCGEMSRLTGHAAKWTASQPDRFMRGAHEAAKQDAVQTS